MISLQNLSFSYTQDRHKVFDNLNLHIARSSWVVVTGPDGSGKTTLGKLVKGLLAPDSGSIRLDGPSLQAADAVGYVGGDPADFAVGMTVEEDVVFGMENMGLEPKEMYERLHDALMRTGLQGMGRRLVHTLSGGEQQKLALAGVLAMRVKVLIMDEALAMLDKPVRRSIRPLMAALREDPGLTIMEMTGSIEDMSSADRVIYLSNGIIEFDGTPSEFLSSRLGIHWSSMNSGLQALHSALHDRGLVTADRADMPGTIPAFINYFNKVKLQARK